MRLAALLALLATVLAGCAPRAPAPVPAAAPQVAVAHPRFADADPHEGIGTRPARYPVHGIDVSRWQGAVDWQQAHAAGVSFAYIKATEGGDILDPAFRRYWQGAKAAGLRHGAYHYFYFCRPAAEQAAWFIAHVPRNPSALPPGAGHGVEPPFPHLPAPPLGREGAGRGEGLPGHPRTPLWPPPDHLYHRGFLPRHRHRPAAAHAVLVALGRRATVRDLPRHRLAVLAIHRHRHRPRHRPPVDINVFAGGLEDWASFAR